jgi:hypothetical protein
MADVAPGVPLNGTIEIAGSERLPLDEIVGRFLNANRDPSQAAADIYARCFGTELNDRSLVPGRQSAHRSDTVRGLVQPCRIGGHECSRGFSVPLPW